MVDAPASDKTLLERLNALKPSTVALDSPSKSVPASTIEPAKPPSKDDALTERLKNLRNQSDAKASNTSDSEVYRKYENTTTSSTLTQLTPPRSGATSLDPDKDTPAISATPPVVDDVDPLLHTDEQTLEELLADLGADQEWLDEVAAEQEEHRRVTALLEELGKASLEDQSQDDPANSKVKDDGDESSSDDDSEGDTMIHEADNVLAQAADEAEWEKANEPTPIPEAKSHPHASGDKPPSTSRGPSSSDPFDLPAVPSDLQDQPNLPDDSQEEADFAASIASRMAALKVSTPPGPTLPSAPTSEVDALGLPIVPTFVPADRPAPGLIKRVGYTDEDQKTWCIVCLEDGAIRCLGCDGEIYCARCWKEMHVGPAAGYDERGHRWEKFVKGR